ncbi:MAG: hypothetical protein ACI87H_003671, partial [Gammaproteobacteria bacterium]
PATHRDVGNAGIAGANTRPGFSQPIKRTD